MSNAQFWHFWCGIVFFAIYLLLKQQVRQNRLFLHPLFLAIALPMLYLGTALADWHLRFLGIEGLRNPILHSAIPYLVLAFLWGKIGYHPTADNLTGQRLVVGAHVGLAIGLGSHLILNIALLNKLQWIPNAQLDRLWLAGNALMLGYAAWYPRYIPRPSVGMRRVG